MQNKGSQREENETEEVKVRKLARQMERKASSPLGKMQTNASEVKQCCLGLKDPVILKLLLGSSSA